MEEFTDDVDSVGAGKDTILEDIPLSDKTYNALNNAGIEKLSQIAKYYYSGKLRQIKGIGNREEKELEAIIAHRPRKDYSPRPVEYDSTTPESVRRKDLFIDWLDENLFIDDLPNLVYSIESFEEYASNFNLLKVPMFNEYSPYAFEDILDSIEDEYDSTDYLGELYGEILLLIGYYIDFLYEEDAGVHYKRGKRKK